MISATITVAGSQEPNENGVYPPKYLELARYTLIQYPACIDENHGPPIILLTEV